MNVGLSGQPIFFDYQILLKYEDYIKDDITIILPISIFTFAFDMDNTELNESNVRRYENLIGYEYYDLSFKDMIFNQLPIFRAKLGCFRIVKDVNRGDNDFYYYTLDHIDMTEDELLEESKAVYENHSFYNNGTVRKTNTDALEGIIDFCKSRNINLVMVTTPNSQYFLDNWDEEYVDTVMYDVVLEYSEKYDIPYYDYSHDERVVSDINNFGNSDHLNAKGRKLFTEIVLNDLNLLD